MKNLRWILPNLLLVALTASGCWLVSGQYTVSKDLPNPLNVTGPPNLVFAQIDLNLVEEYKDHKDDLKGIADCALLGTFRNNAGTGLSLEVWLTPGLTAHTTESGLNSDGSRVKLWGPLNLGAGQSITIGWDQSTKLFAKAGKNALLGEVKGDGSFTLYAKGSGSGYNFTVTNGVAVVVIEAGK